ncbi:MAG: RHS repeat-associated core domain-containing protein, partial [Planctomycetes bacterium]|nr:RHS repeat-associated core domain-containing protein [Planctomycetota bacterium]
GTTSYSYDASGNLIEKSAPEGVTTYGYDWQDRLVTVTTPEHTASYEYDHDGIRVAKTVDGVRINFTVDKNRPYAQVIEERDDGGALLASYIHGVDLISQHRDGHDYYYHTDEQGSVVTLSDENGAKASSYFYTAYGDLWRTYGGATAEMNKYRYTGEQFDDETGFYYLRARYYDPGVGRFVTRDTWAGDPINPLSMNKYLYGNANPMLYVDPSGHFGLVGAMASVNISGMMANVSVSVFMGFFKSGGGGGGGGSGWTIASAQKEANRLRELMVSYNSERYYAVEFLISEFRNGNNHYDAWWASQERRGLPGDVVFLDPDLRDSENYLLSFKDVYYGNDSLNWHLLKIDIYCPFRGAAAFVDEEFLKEGRGSRGITDNEMTLFNWSRVGAFEGYIEREDLANW